MTPATIRLVSQLRQEFYARFAAAMKVPVHITHGNSYASNLATASWLDRQQRLNYVCVYAHTAPDDLIPERPLTLRVAINRGAEVGSMSRREKGCQGFNRSRHFELTVLPEEILDFLPWIIALVKYHDNNSAAAISEPPHPFNLQMSNALLLHQAQTHKASARLTRSTIVAQEPAPCRAAGFGMWE